MPDGGSPSQWLRAAHQPRLPGTLHDGRVNCCWRLWWLLVMVAVAGCTGTAPPERAEPSPAAGTSRPTVTATAPAPRSPAQPPAAAAVPKPAAPHPVSLQSLMAKRYDGWALRVGRTLARSSGYTRYFV